MRHDGELFEFIEEGNGATVPAAFTPHTPQPENVGAFRGEWGDGRFGSANG